MLYVSLVTLTTRCAHSFATTRSFYRPTSMLLVASTRNRMPHLMMSTLSSSAELDELEQKIKLKGDEIRELKASGLDKTALEPHVAELLALKAQLPTQQQATKPPAEPKATNKKSPLKESPPKKKVEEVLSDSELRQARWQKVLAMREAGVEPFAYGYSPTYTALQLLNEYGDRLENGEEDVKSDVAVAGRVMTRRVFGKLAFFTIQDETGTAQLQFDAGRLGDSFEVSKNAYIL